MSEAMRACEAHPWPGNLGQLRNVIKQDALVGDETLLLTSLEQNSQTYSYHTCLAKQIAHIGCPEANISYRSLLYTIDEHSGPSQEAICR